MQRCDIDIVNNYHALLAQARLLIVKSKIQVYMGALAQKRRQAVTSLNILLIL